MQKYIRKSEQINHYLELEDITTDMIEELREKSLFSLVNGLDYYIIQIAKDLQKYDDDCKNIILDSNRLTWIKREVKDSKFDFDTFQEDVKEAMIYTQENYEK